MDVFFCRKNPQVVVVNGRMYVTSSNEESEGQSDSESSIEVYEPIDDSWRNYTSNLGWQPANSTASVCYQGGYYNLGVVLPNVVKRRLEQIRANLFPVNTIRVNGKNPVVISGVSLRHFLCYHGLSQTH